MAGAGEYPKENGDVLYSLDFNNSMGRVITKTADYTVESSEAYNSVLSNKGATETITFTLPAAAENMSFKIGRVEDYPIIITPDGADTINDVNGSFASGSGDDKVIELIAIANNEWIGEKLITNLYGRGLFGGGYTGSVSNVIDYVTIDATGNATDFGDLTVARRLLASCSSSVRGLFGGGYETLNVIDYVTIASTGNATNFGDLTVARDRLAGCSSNTLGLFGGGDTGSESDVMDYVTIANTGNASDFGNLTVARNNIASCSSTTRGLFGGGYDGGSKSNVIDSVTIANTGNATDFGDLTVSRNGVVGCSNSTRGLFGGGFAGSRVDVIDYVTIASAGNATDFGDVSADKNTLGACSSPDRGLFAGGHPWPEDPGPYLDVIEYVTIANTSNTTDFGDLTVARDGLAGCSNSHGGL